MALSFEAQQRIDEANRAYGVPQRTAPVGIAPPTVDWAPDMQWQGENVQGAPLPSYTTQGIQPQAQPDSNMFTNWQDAGSPSLSSLTQQQGWTRTSLGNPTTTGQKIGAVASGLQSILQSSQSTGSSSGERAVGVAESTVGGIAAGAATGASFGSAGGPWGAIVGGVVGLGVGIGKAIINKKKSEDANAAVEKENTANEEYNRQARVLNQNAIIETGANQRHSQDQYYNSLNPMQFSKNLMLGFTRAHRG